jgi:hypothetical protein
MNFICELGFKKLLSTRIFTYSLGAYGGKPGSDFLVAVGTGSGNGLEKILICLVVSGWEVFQQR